MRFCIHLERTSVNCEPDYKRLESVLKTINSTEWTVMLCRFVIYRIAGLISIKFFVGGPCRYSSNHVTFLSRWNSIIRALHVDWGPRWRSWLRHCATSQKVAGSIPDGVIGIFH